MQRPRLDYRLLAIVLVTAGFSVSLAEDRLNHARLNQIPRVVKQGIARGNMPGCVVLIGYRGRIEYHKAFGHRQLQPSKVPMTIDTVFDLASLTKPVATATSIMHLVQRDQLKLDDPVSKYFPDFAANGKQTITVTDLLTHQSGLLPDNALRDYLEGSKTAYAKIDALSLRSQPGERFIYSDVGFIVLARLIEHITGDSVHQYSQKNLFQPLGMQHTGYLPAAPLRERAAPTTLEDEEWLKGRVHDPRASALGGIAGHAGLFSTAEDLFRYAQMLINGGMILDKDTIRQMIAPVQTSGGLRCLGWDVDSVYSSNRGDLLSSSAFGHGGFTGTAMWIDPEQELVLIFLSNRLHPDGKGAVNSIAGRINTIAAAAIPGSSD